MKCHFAFNVRTLRTAFLAVAAIAAVCLASPSSSRAQSVYRVEEEWELVVTAPRASSGSPQVTMAMSPSQDTNCWHATFELNHRTQPDFVPGGLSLQLWRGEGVYTAKSFPDQGSLHHDNEKITWTQVMTLHDGELTIEVVDGHSDSWGRFGGQGYLRSSVSTGLAHLNDYSPKWSAQQSGIGFGEQRVKSLKLKKARLYLKDGPKLEADVNYEVKR